MGRGNNQKTRDGNKGSLPQVPKNLKISPDGIDAEFSRELADADDMEAQKRADAADKRQKSK